MRDTKQRECIYNIVNNSCDHLNAYQIYNIARESIYNISLGTVYRNLTWLSNNGSIRNFIVDGIIRYDRNTEHDHFICDRCSCIIDIPKTYFDSNYIQENLVIDYDINYRGICLKCQRKEDNNGTKGK